VAGLEVVPTGLVFRAWRAGRPPPPPAIPVLELAGEHDPRVPKDHLTQNLIGHFHYMLGVTFEDRDWPRARRELALAAARAPDNDVLFYNLGLIYRRNGLLDEAVAAFERSHAINPRPLASVQDARAATRLDEVRAEAARLARIEQELAADPSVAASGAPGSHARHLRLAELLARRGEHVAARGHRLRALASS
jgi:tetratricopeptide (TPR) repeat protein